jgi:hypothetical protein
MERTPYFGHGRRQCGRAGGVGIRVLWICLSLSVIAGAMAGLFNFQQKNEERNSRKAMEISEYGFFRVMEKLSEKPSWNAGFPKTPYEGGWYWAKVIPRVKGDTVFLSVESVGRMGGVSKKQECLLRHSVVNGDSVWVRTSAP